MSECSVPEALKNIELDRYRFSQNDLNKEEYFKRLRNFLGFYYLFKYRVILYVFLFGSCKNKQSYHVKIKSPTA